MSAFVTYRWLGRLLSDRLEQFKLHEHLFPIVAGMLIGLLCGLAAVVFRWMIMGVEEVLWGAADESLAFLKAQPAWRILAIPAVGGLLVGWLIRRFCPEARGHGVAEVIAAVAVRHGVIRARVAVVKAVTAAITIGSGGSAGPEGPVIQIGAAIGSSLGRRLRVSRERLRTFVGCGAAAGLAATFNAPIAGAMFAVEVILGEFGAAQFSPIIISSVVATLIARHAFGSGPVFTVPDYHLASVHELLAYVVLGVLSGLISVLFIRTLYGVEALSKRFQRVSDLAKPMLGGLLVGGMALAIPHVMGDGHTVINLALLNRIPWGLLLVLIFGKMLATSLTLGSGGSGGVFAPSLFMGAMLGGLCGQLVALGGGNFADSAGGFALAGMCGVVAGTTHAPISAILMIFEITSNYSLILPLMTVCIISMAISMKLSPQSIYTLKLVQEGIDLFRGRSLDLLKKRWVSECVKEQFVTVLTGTPARDWLPKVRQSDVSQVYVVDKDGGLKGIIPMYDALRLLMSQGGLDQVLLADDLARKQAPMCLRSETLSLALGRFASAGLQELPVVEDSTSMRLTGVLRYADVLAVYQEEIMNSDTAGEMASRVRSLSGQNPVEVVKGFDLVEWVPPSFLWGKTLREADLPNRQGVRVVLIKRVAPEGEDVQPFLPGPDYRIGEQDHLVVIGRSEDIARTRQR